MEFAGEKQNLAPNQITEKEQFDIEDEADSEAKVDELDEAAEMMRNAQ